MTSTSYGRHVITSFDNNAFIHVCVLNVSELTLVLLTLLFKKVISWRNDKQV